MAGAGPYSLKTEKAGHDYHIYETYEAGIALEGCEVKSIRNGKANLQDSFLHGLKGQRSNSTACIFHPMNRATAITPGSHPHPKAALNRNEINKLSARVQEKGLTMVPVKLYFKHGRVKILLAVAKGKKQLCDKRDKLKEKEANRDIDRALRNRQKN